jgi:hypothetical protein
MRPGPVLVRVVQAQAELPGQGQRGGVLGIDELGVPLDQLPIREVAAHCADPAARHGVVLVDLGLDAVPGPQPVRAAQPGDA